MNDADTDTDTDININADDASAAVAVTPADAPDAPDVPNDTGFRVPVMAKEAVIEFPNGQQSAGLVYLPAAAPDHDGAMRLVEWLNAPEPFFPFRIHGEEGTVLVNKHIVLSLTAYHDRDSGDYDEVDDARKRGVRVETLRGVIEGRMIVDTPYHKRRVLDVLNGGKRFIFLLDSGKEVHINQNFIIKAMEIEGDQSAGTV